MYEGECRDKNVVNHKTWVNGPKNEAQPILSVLLTENSIILGTDSYNILALRRPSATPPSRARFPWTGDGWIERSLQPRIDHRLLMSSECQPRDRLLQQRRRGHLFKAGFHFLATAVTTMTHRVGKKRSILYLTLIE